MHTVRWLEKTEEKRPLGRPRRRWEYNIKMDLREVSRMGLCGLEASGSDQWRAVVNTVMKFRVALKAGNFLTE